MGFVPIQKILDEIDALRKKITALEVVELEKNSVSMQFFQFFGRGVLRVAEPPPFFNQPVLSLRRSLRRKLEDMRFRLVHIDDTPAMFCGQLAKRIIIRSVGWQEKQPGLFKFPLSSKKEKRAYISGCVSNNVIEPTEVNLFHYRDNQELVIVILCPPELQLVWGSRPSWFGKQVA